MSVDPKPRQDPPGDAEFEARRRRYIRNVNRLVRNFDQFERAQVIAMGEMLKRLSVEVDTELQDIISGGGEGLFRAHHLRLAYTAIERAAAQLQDQYGVLMRYATGRAWEMGDEFTRGSFDETGLDLIVSSGIDTQALNAALTVGAELVHEVSTTYRTQARSAIARGIAGTQPDYLIRRQLREMLKAQPARADTQRFGNIYYQAERILRTELNSAWSTSNTARQLDVAERNPKLEKIWLATKDGRTRPTHSKAGGQYRPGGSPGPIPIKKDYQIGGYPAKGPHDPRLPARLRVNCRCRSGTWSSEWLGVELPYQPDPITSKPRTTASGDPRAAPQAIPS